MGIPIPPEPPVEPGNNCSFCTAGETPKYITVFYSGLSVCSGCSFGWDMISLESSLVIVYKQVPASPCIYYIDYNRYPDGIFAGTCYHFQWYDCTGVRWGPFDIFVSPSHLNNYIQKKSATNIYLSLVVKGVHGTEYHYWNPFLINNEPVDFTGCFDILVSTPNIDGCAGGFCTIQEGIHN